MLGIIGGTGLYKIDGLVTEENRIVRTPFGESSASVLLGKIGNTPVAFLPRHGTSHGILPGEINYRANIFALKKVGVTQILSVSATGSLREEIAPGELAVPHQYFDWTRGKRVATFFGEGVVAHIATAEPSCANLTDTIRQAAQANSTAIHFAKTYACIEGPRLGTRAESLFLRQIGCDLVGMTNVPEVFLAREAQMCYATIAIATDYDSWLDDPTQHVNVAKVFELYGKNIGRVQALIKSIAMAETSKAKCSCRQSLEGAVVTPEESLSSEKRELLKVLKA